MPYHNMPQSMWGKMDKCVSDVQGKGRDKKSAIAICYTSLMKGKELDAMLKSFDLKAAPHYRFREKASDKASDYLVVEDPDKPTTWHLQVKVDGAPDHRLMGAAWAALHGGYRGNTYEGPNKGEAIAKLRKLYEAEKMPVPSEKAITDAPNLRGDGIQNCANCKYAEPIITEDAMMGMAMPMDAVAMMEAKQSGGATLVCTQYEFETDPDWVCDSWETVPMPAAVSQSKELSVFKQADGHYRWVAFTSSSYKDRDGEIVSQKALESDTARMDAASDYGVLDWWHTPIRLGACDFSAMHGNIRVESGTFDDDFIGEKFAAASKELAASLAFYHPIDEPDAQGVFHHIQTFRRALLPRGKESNLLTMLYVSKEEKEMLADKVKAMVDKLGGNKVAEEKVKALLDAAEATDKAAEGVLEHKEATPAPVAPPEPPKEDKPIVEQPGMFVADMKPEEFDTHLKEASAKALAELLAPVLAELKTQIAAIGEAQATATKEANASIVAQFKAITEAQAELDKRLKELEGLTPRGYRPTQDAGTQISKEKAEALKPKPDEKQPKDKELSAWVAEPVEQVAVPQ